MGGVWAALSQSVRGLLAAHPLWTVAAVMFGEELGVPSPVPSDFMMLLAGEQVRRGTYPFWAVLLVQEAATLVGSTGLFLFSRRYGRVAVARYGWLLHLGPTTLDRAEAALRRQGARAVLTGRLIPGLRIVTPIAAGIGGLPLGQFLPAVAVGALLYILAFNLIGFLAGPAALALFERVALPTGALLSLAVVALVIFLIRNVKREVATFARGGEGAAVAARLDGLLAGVLALVATYGIVGVAAFAARPFGRDVPLGTEEVGTGLRLLLSGPVFLLVASLLGVIDERLGTERLPWPARSLVLSGVPLLLTLVLAALAARGVVPLATGGGAYLVAVEVVRWAAFGVALGELLPLDAELHQIPSAPAETPAV
jgi:membrane protein DedA with SNARE-associated domain